jgi:hypothetical protein
MMKLNEYSLVWFWKIFFKKKLIQR